MVDQSEKSQTLSGSGARFYCGYFLKAAVEKAMVIVSAVFSGPVLQPSDVFEQHLPTGQRKIEFHISAPEVAATVEGSGLSQRDDEVQGKGSA